MTERDITSMAQDEALAHIATMRPGDSVIYWRGEFAGGPHSATVRGLATCYGLGALAPVQRALKDAQGARDGYDFIAQRTAAPLEMRALLAVAKSQRIKIRPEHAEALGASRGCDD